METLIFAALGIVFAIFIMSVVAYLSIRITVEEIALCETIPEQERAQLMPGEKIVTALGFVEHHAQKAVHRLNKQVLTQWQRIYYHPEHGTYASVATPIDAKNRVGFEITFETFYNFPRILLSVNNRAHHYMPHVEGQRLEDLYTDSYENVFKHHLEVQSTIPDKPKRPDAAAYAANDMKLFRHTMRSSVENGDYRANGEMFTPTIKGAAHIIIATWLNARRASKMQKRIAAIDERPDTTQNDLQLYRTRKAAQDNTLGMWGKLGLFAGSLVLFTLAFGFTLSAQTVLIIILILLLHEGGHLAAMYLLGYRDLQILFLPFLGAVATAKQADTGAVKSFIVSIMGPLPGIVLGVILLQNSGPETPEWLMELIYMMLFLNLFNLLPVMPLDGGQIVNKLLFYHHPRLQAAFALLSAFMFLGMALIMGDVLWLLAALTLWLAYDSFGKAMFRRAFFKHCPVNDALEEAPYLEKIFALFQQKKYRHFSFDKKFGYAEHLMQLRGFKPVRLGMLSLLMTLYLASLFAPPVLVAKHAFNSFTSDDGNASRIAIEKRLEERARGWEAEIAAQTDDEARWDMLMQAAEAFEYYDNNRSRHYYDAALQLAQKGWSDGNRTVRSLRHCAEAAEYDADRTAERYYLQIVQILEGQPEPDKTELAEIYGKLALGDYNQTLAPKYLKWQQTHVTLLENAPDADPFALVSAYEMLAAMEQTRGDLSGAESDLQKAYTVAENGGDAYTLFHATESIIRFYFETQRYAEGLALTERTALPVEEHDHREAIEFQKLKGWLYYRNNRFQEAHDAFATALMLSHEQIERINDGPFLLNWFMDISDSANLILLGPLQDMMVVELRLNHTEKAKKYYERFEEIIVRSDEFASVDDFMASFRDNEDFRFRTFGSIIAAERMETLRQMRTEPDS